MAQIQAEPNRKTFALWPQIIALTTSRTIINTNFRMVYPLLPVFATGVGTDVATIASILTLVQLIGLSAPFMGALSERRGRRFVILLGVAIYTIGVTAVFFMPNVNGFAVALLVGGFGKMAFDPAVQAYLGDRVPYERRGRILGLLELGWSGAFLLGVPLMTWLIAQFNWQAPFAALAILGAGSFVALYVLLTPDKPEVVSKVSFRQAIGVALNSRMAIAGLVLGAGISAANQMVNVVFGLWIEDSFEVLLAALAISTVVIGSSELLGEGFVAGFSDRFGKRRLVMVGIIGNIIASLLLPFTASSLAWAMAGLFFFYITFETALVATIPLITELSPQARAMYVSVYVAAVTSGRAAVTPLAPILFESGLEANVGAAIVFNLIALVAVWRFISVK